MRRHTHTWTAAGLVALMAAMILTAATEVAAQGVNLRGKTRLNLGGTATFGDTTGATAIAGVSRFTEGGYEFGGDIWGYFSRHSTSATVLVRAGRNFIGESRTVPFVTGGLGAPLGSVGGYLWDAGGGFRQFTEDGLMSMDVTAGWQGGSRAPDQAIVRFGLSFYFGG